MQISKVFLALMAMGFVSVMSANSYAAPLDDDLVPIITSKAAGQGDAKAQFGLGQNFEKDKNFQQAFALYKKSADQGYLPAKVALARFYLDGIEVNKDPIFALELLRTSAEQNDPLALYYTGVILTSQLIPDADVQAGIDALHKAAEQTDNLEIQKQARTLLAPIFLEGKIVDYNYDQAFEFFKSINTPESLNQAAVILTFPHNAKRDLHEANKLFEQVIADADEDDNDQLKLDALYNQAKYICLDSHQDICPLSTGIKTLTSNSQKGHLASQIALINQYLNTPADSPYLKQFDFDWFKKLFEYDSLSRKELFEKNSFRTKNLFKDGEISKFAAQNLPILHDAEGQFLIAQLFQKGISAELLNQNNGGILGGVTSLFKGDAAPLEPNNEKAWEWYTKAAEQGHLQAQLLLGFAYFEGTKVNPDYDKAYKWLSAASEHHNDPKVQYYLGLILAQGLVVNADHQKGVELLEATLEQESDPAIQKKIHTLLTKIYMEGKLVATDYTKVLQHGQYCTDPFSYNSLGLIYAQGLDVPQDLELANQNFNLAIQGAERTGDKKLQEKATLNRALYVCTQPSQNYCSLEDSISTLSKLANLNNTQAQQALLQSYQVYGKDPKLAKLYSFSWLNDDVINTTDFKEDSQLIFMLAKLYEIGTVTNDIPQNLAKAKALYRKAAALGYTPAIIAEANFYLNGSAEEQDINKAYKLLHGIVDQNVPSALYMLGEIYFRPNSYHDLQKAFDYFEQAAAQEQDLQTQELAKAKLGTFYLQGLLRAPDYPKAMEMFSQSNTAYSYNQMGIMFAQGMGVNTDLKQALSLFKLAHEKGDKKLQEEATLNRAIYVCIQPGQNYCSLEDSISTLSKFANLNNTQAQQALLQSYQVYGKSPKLAKLYSFSWLNDDLINTPAFKEDAQIIFMLAKLYEIGTVTNDIPQDLAKAKALYRKAAALGNTPAILAEANIYLNGPTEEQDINKAYEILHDIVDKDVPGALYMLGEIYFRPSSYHDLQKAFDYFELAAAQDQDLQTQELAKAKLGTFYMQGLLRAPNYPKAMDMFSQSNTATSYNQMGVMFAQGLGVHVDLKQALSLFKLAYTKAEQTGNSEEMYNSTFNQAAYICGNPQLDVCNFRDKVKMLYTAASHGHTGARDMLFNLYMEGNNSAEEFYTGDNTWLEEQARKHNGYALTLLGEMNAMGILPGGTNIHNAVNLLKHAVEQRNSRAKMLLSIIYQLGKVPPEIEEDDYSPEAEAVRIAMADPKQNWFGNTEQAMDLLEEAAEDNYVPAQSLYGCLMLKDKPKKAGSQLLAAANLGDVKAQAALGFMHYAALGKFDKNFVTALNLYSSGVKANDTDALVGLGIMYLTGEGVTQDRRKAAQLFKQASYNNKMANIMLLIMLENHMDQGFIKDYASTLYDRAIKLENNVLTKAFVSPEILSTGFMLGPIKIEKQLIEPLIRNFDDKCASTNQAGACSLAKRLKDLNKLFDFF